MLLLPGSLTSNRATLAALSAGLSSHPDIAHALNMADLRETCGSWSDAERDASGESDDLQDGIAIAHHVLKAGDNAVSVVIATPLHAALGLTDLTPIDPSKLSLSEDESRALCEAADAHLREDGVRLHFVDATRWLLTSNQSVEVLTERPDWIIGEMLRPNLPRGRDARLVERWMNELQMLLHVHPVNSAREERRLLPVNLVWLWGFGTLDPSSNSDAVGDAPTEHSPHLAHLQALRNVDVPAWQNAWKTLSPEILSAQTIILGDSRPRLRLTVTTPSLPARLLSTFKRKATLAEALAKLQQSL